MHAMSGAVDDSAASTDVTAIGIREHAAKAPPDPHGTLHGLHGLASDGSGGLGRA
jgi:hypothetical protein